MKKITKRIIAIALFVMCFWGTGKGLRYLLTDDTNSYTRVMFHELYNSPVNISTLFVGSSHVYNSIDPVIVDEQLNTYSFNAGSSSQYMDGSLAMIKEADRYYDIDKVFVEVYYGVVESISHEERPQLTSTYILSDYMRPSPNKYVYLVQAGGKQHYINDFIIARRNWEKLFDIEYMKSLWDKKNTEEYRSYRFEPGSEADMTYKGRGFAVSDRIPEANQLINTRAYGSIRVGEIDESEWKKDLVKINDYCKQHGIEMIMYVAPEPEWTLVGKKNYQEYNNVLNDIAHEFDVTLWDFNLVRDEYFNTNDSNMFADADHLNYTGAQKFTALLCDLYSDKSEADEMFHGSFDEKMGQRETYVYGIADDKEKRYEDFRKCYIIANNAEGIEYKIVAMPDSGEEYVIQEFDSEDHFTLPLDETGTLCITYRKSAGEELSLETRY